MATFTNENRTSTAWSNQNKSSAPTFTQIDKSGELGGVATGLICPPTYPATNPWTLLTKS